MQGFQRVKTKYFFLKNPCIALPSLAKVTEVSGEDAEYSDRDGRAPGLFRRTNAVIEKSIIRPFYQRAEKDIVSNYLYFFE